MITVNSVIGNIYKDKVLGKKYQEMSSRSLCESIKINRIESQRVRMRKTSTKGMDIVLILPSSTNLRHGDVLLLTNEQIVTVELEPENVILVEVKDNIHDDDVVEIPARIGHTIGNLHRPLKLEGRKIYFPIQAESEIEMFKKILSPLMDHLEIRGTKMVFEPDGETDVHEH